MEEKSGYPKWDQNVAKKFKKKTRSATGRKAAGIHWAQIFDEARIGAFADSWCGLKRGRKQGEKRIEPRTNIA